MIDAESGVAREVPALANISLAEETVFSVLIWNRLDASATIGDLLSTLRGLVLEGPRYIRISDRGRYLSLLYTFGRHHLPPDAWLKRQGGIVEELPVQDLGRALNSWVENCFRSPQPFMVSLALDTASFIKAHCCGHYFHSERARIGPIFPEDISEKLFNAFLFIDKTLKKDVTQRNIGGTTVRARVPAGARIKGRGPLHGELPPGTEFLFVVKRCHLSETVDPFEGMSWLSVEEPDALDIAAGFEFAGEVYAKDIGVSDKDVLTTIATDIEDARRGLTAVIPFSWFTHHYERAGRGAGRFVPLPQFDLQPIALVPTRS